MAKLEAKTKKEKKNANKFEKLTKENPISCTHCNKCIKMQGALRKRSLLQTKTIKQALNAIEQAKSAQKNSRLARDKLNF